MKKRTFEMEFAGRKLILSTGELALQANAAVVVQYGDTVVMATAVMSTAERDGIDYFPLMVEYQEKMYAAGKIKGGRFIKREGRPTDEAVLIGRMIDRGLRPLFDQTMRREVQLIINVLSYDGENDPDVPGIIAASAALHLSDIPWNGPLAGVRVGRIGGEWVLNPTYEARTKSELDLALSVSADKVLMVDAEAKEAPEDVVYEAFEFALKHGKQIVTWLNKIRDEIGLPKQVIVPKETTEDENKKTAAEEILALQKECRELALPLLDKYLFNIPKGSKNERKKMVHEIYDQLVAHLEEKQVGKDRIKKVMEFFETFLNDEIVKAILKKERRIDGRKLDQIRDLDCRVGLFTRLHGTGLFQRGETQVLSIVTLGSPGDEQVLDGMEVAGKKRYMHHYNFPPFSTGETGMMRGTGRREIGHGALAEKALLPVLPSKEEFPYTIRVVSEVMGSNGSSSMGSTCGSTLALMDAGVPIKKPVAGIAIGLASDKSGDYKILTDIQDFEDGEGGMDFKVTGTRDGITAIQMDTKTDGLTLDIIKGALTAGYKARLEILDVIAKCLPAPRAELSEYAPRIVSFYIKPAKIREVIGPGGKVINEIIDATGVQIDIEDDGLVLITGVQADKVQQAVDWVKSIVQEAEIGKVYTGKIVKLMDFGAFVEIFPGSEGMVHVSEITDKERVNDIHKYLKEGQVITVKCINIDDQGRVRLSMKKVAEDK